MRYGQFCPVAKATELVGERWTFLIIRELLMGGRRFSGLQRGLGEISPALLTARLKMFEAEGLVVRRKIPGQRGFEYFPTKACEALLPVIVALGENGGSSSMVKRRSSAWWTRAGTLTCGSVRPFIPCMTRGWAIAPTAPRSMRANW